MERRGFFSAVLGTGTAAVAVSHPRGLPGRWSIEPLDCPIPCDCGTIGCETGDFNAKFTATDRSTKIERPLCVDCAEAFRRAPYPLLR